MIVKVQLPLAGAQLALIYDEMRSVQFQGPITPELLEFAAGRPRFYARARIVDGLLELLDEADEQAW